MKKKIFMACAALVVSAAAVVGVKAYNHSQLSDFALANIEALSEIEYTHKMVSKIETEDITREVRVHLEGMNEDIVTTYYERHIKCSGELPYLDCGTGSRVEELRPCEIKSEKCSYATYEECKENHRYL